MRSLRLPLTKMLDFSFGIIPFQKTSNGLAVLLVQHKNGRYWSFPKGHPESGEEPIDTACRELKEETGLEIDELLSEETLVERYQFTRNGQTIDKTVTYFLALVSGAFELHKNEIHDARWFSIHDAANIITYDEAKALFEKSLSLLEET